MKSILFLVLMLTMSNILNAQLETSSFNYTLSTEIDSLTSEEYTVLTLDFEVNDIDYLGELIATVYDLESNQPIRRVKVKLDALPIYASVSGNVVTLLIYDIDPTVGFRAEGLARNYQGGNLPILELTHTSE